MTSLGKVDETPVATYHYQTVQGVPVRILRYERKDPQAPKDFKAQHQDVSGVWQRHAHGLTLLPYRIGDIQGATEVFIPEGEADVERLIEMGFVATTNAFGADGWQPQHTEEVLASVVKRIFIPEDNDDAGRRRTSKLKKHFRGKGVEIRVIRFCDLPQSSDTSDYVRLHGADAFYQLVDAVRQQAPERLDDTADQESAPDAQTPPCVAVRSPEVPLVGVQERTPALPGDRAVRNALVPPFITIADWSDEPDAELLWRIEGLQVEGGHSTAIAPAKSGKTTMACNVVKSLVDGTPLFGRFSVTPIDGNLVVFDTEMSPAQGKRWYRDMRIERANRVIPLFLRGQVSTFDVSKKDVRVKWAEALRGQNVRYAVLDCLRPLLDALGLDEHKDAGYFLEAYREMLYMAEISESMLVHHTGHDGVRARGDSRIRDFCDSECSIRRKGEGPNAPRYFRATGRDVCVNETLMLFDPATRALTLAAEVAPTDRRTPSAALLAVCLVFQGRAEGCSGREIKRQLKDHFNPHAVDGALGEGVACHRLTVTKATKKGQPDWYRLAGC